MVEIETKSIYMTPLSLSWLGTGNKVSGIT